MKRVIFLLMLSAYVLCTVANKDVTSEARKKAKALTKDGWILYDPTGGSLQERLIAERQRESLPSKYDVSRHAYIADSQIGKGENLEETLQRVRDACFSSLVVYLRTKVASITATQVNSISSNGGSVQEEQSLLTIMGTKSRECLRNIEEGLVLYRKVKDGYEVQVTLWLCTDILYE